MICYVSIDDNEKIKALKDPFGVEERKSNIDHIYFSPRDAKPVNQHQLPLVTRLSTQIPDRDH